MAPATGVGWSPCGSLGRNWVGWRLGWGYIWITSILGLGLGRELGLKGREGENVNQLRLWMRMWMRISMLMSMAIFVPSSVYQALGLQKPFPRREHPVRPHYQALCVLSDLFRFTGGQSPTGAENVTRIQASNQGGPWGEDDGTGEVGAGSLEAEKLGDGGGYLGRSIPALATKASDRGKQKSRGVDDERHGGRELGGFERDSDRDGDRDKNRVKVRDGRHRERDKDREEGEDRGIDGGGDHRQREKHPESVRRRRHLEGRDNREGSTTYRRRQTNEPRYAKRR
eukprot:1343456-Amorphochlora_amoeboformis.AAC.3